jgi:hypothetical protein
MSTGAPTPVLLLEKAATTLEPLVRELDCTLARAEKTLSSSSVSDKDLDLSPGEYSAAGAAHDDTIVQYDPRKYL